MDSRIIGKCWHCGHGLGKVDYGRETDCPQCHRPTRVCRNCRHYAPGQANDCAEPMAEPVLDKTRANFCEHFEASEAPVAEAGGEGQDALLKAAEDLFKF